jgi:hypothetical protein
MSFWCFQLLGQEGWEREEGIPFREEKEKVFGTKIKN